MLISLLPTPGVFENRGVINIDWSADIAVAWRDRRGEVARLMVATYLACA